MIFSVLILMIQILSKLILKFVRAPGDMQSTLHFCIRYYSIMLINFIPVFIDNMLVSYQ